MMEIAKDFLESSTIHGLSYISRAKVKVHKPSFELKSKTLSDKLLCGLQGLAEKEAKQLKGQVCFNELIMLKTINGLYKICIFQKFKLYNL